MLRFALLDTALRRLLADPAALQLSLGFAQLGFELKRVHVGNDLSNPDLVTFMDKDFPDSSGRARGNVDGDSLDAAVAACNAGW